MSLVWHLSIHVALALLAGFIVWRIWGESLVAFSAAFLGGVLVDLDHLFDFFLAYGTDFNLAVFLSGRYFDLNQKIYVLFHGWEYVILALGAALFCADKRLKVAFFSLALGMLVHLGADTILNQGMKWQGYSFLFRAIHQFEIKEIAEQDGLSFSTKH